VNQRIIHALNSISKKPQPHIEHTELLKLITGLANTVEICEGIENELVEFRIRNQKGRATSFELREEIRRIVKTAPLKPQIGLPSVLKVLGTLDITPDEKRAFTSLKPPVSIESQKYLLWEWLSHSQADDRNPDYFQNFINPITPPSCFDQSYYPKGKLLVDAKGSSKSKCWIDTEVDELRYFKPFFFEETTQFKPDAQTFFSSKKVVISDCEEVNVPTAITKGGFEMLAIAAQMIYHFYEEFQISNIVLLTQNVKQCNYFAKLLTEHCRHTHDKPLTKISVVGV
jgi:hypothetical protein